MNNEVVKTSEKNLGMVICSREVANMCGKEHNKLLRDIRNYCSALGDTDCNISDFFIKNTYMNNQNKKQPCYSISVCGVKMILDNQRNNVKNKKLYEWYSSHSNGDIVVLYNRKEIEFMEMLSDALLPLNITFKEQYKVLSYRIDCYIECLNIAVEYDENDHKNYTYEQHEGRQREIENELGCTFIRVSDKDSYAYNIGVVMKEILNKIRIAS